MSKKRCPIDEPKKLLRFAPDAIAITNEFGLFVGKITKDDGCPLFEPGDEYLSIGELLEIVSEMEGMDSQ